MRVVLAEKPSVARELASFLGAGARRDGYFEGRGYQVTWALGHLVTLKEPQDYDPALKQLVAGRAALRPRALRAQAARRQGGRQAARGRQAPLPRRRRADLRHGRRPRGRADLPLHPGADRLHRQAGAAALAQLADRGRHPRRLRPPPAAVRLRRAVRRGPVPERGRLGRRPERDPLLHRPPPRRRPALERRAGADAGAGDDRPPRRRDPHLQARAVLGAADPLPRGHVQVRGRPLRQGGGRPGGPAAGAGAPLHRPGRRAQAGAGPAAAALRPDRAAAGHEPAIRAVGRRHAEGGPGALRGQADQLPEDRLALPGRRHEGRRSRASWASSGPSSRPRSASWTSTPSPSPGGSSTTRR